MAHSHTRYQLDDEQTINKFQPYSKFNAGFNDTQFEMLAICLKSKQNSTELLIVVNIY